MSKFKEIFIINFLRSRGWEIKREGTLFNYYIPPQNLKLPFDFELEIPKHSHDKPGFDNYIDQLIQELSAFLPNESNVDDLKILFSKQNSILKYRVFDSDNSDGTISLQKHIDSLDVFKKVLSQAVIFTATNKPIFGDAKFEVEGYLNRCRSLQTEKGSYVTKIEIPHDKIYTAVSEIDTKTVNNKLFDVIEFIEEEIFNTKEEININESYIQENSRHLNYELFRSIKDLYLKTTINNIEFQLSSNDLFRRVETTKVQKRIPYFNQYLRDVKKILLDVVPLEAIGYIKRLASSAPLHSKKNEIIIDAEISNSKETIKIILNSEEYLEAIEAHKNEWLVKVKGKAQQGKTMLSLKELESFEIIKK